jgi:tetratricopeptide (TPR) repeat protein
VVLVAETATGAYLLHHEHLHHEYAAAAASLFDAALKRIETIKEDLEETNIKIKSAIPLSERTRDAWALRFLRGTANLLYHNPNLSLEDWDFLVGVSWEEARVENNRGVAQTALGHPKEALVSLKSALRKRGGNNRSVRNNLAVAYFIHEDYVHAVAEIREALSASEKNGTHRIVTENAVAIALAAQDLALADHSIGSMEDDPGQDWQQPLRQLVVKAKAIDPAPVTITAFHACVADGACTPIHQTAKWRLRGHNYAEEPSYSHCRNSPSDTPVTCIDWEQAWAYCRWQKKRLPVLTYLRYLASDSKEPATKIAEWTTSPECPLQPAPACTSKRQSIYSRIPDRHLIRPPRAPQPDQDANTASATTKDRYESVGFRCAPPWPVE